MKRFSAIFLLSVILTYTFSQATILIEYLVDIEAYTAKYCENTDKPEIECNGKCHLSKELAKDQENKNPENLQVFSNIHLFVVSDITLPKKPFLPAEKEEDNFSYQESFLSRLIPPPFLPPDIS